MKILYKKLIVLMGVLWCTTSSAVVLNNAAFVKYGGDINDTVGTFRTTYLKLTEKSYSAQFLSVGTIPGCTATWIGNTADQKFSYILTAAHCVGYNSVTGSTNISFWNYKGETIASGGTYFVPPQRLNKPAGYGGASTDIAILKLSRVKTLVDQSGNAVAVPWLNDLTDEVGKTVNFVGHGTWGTAKDGNQGGWFPSSGPRRAWAESKISGVFEMEHGIGAGFDAGDVNWSRVAPGDSGSAWWQSDASNKYYIIAATNGGGSGSTGSRVSAYKDWINSVAPEVQWRSEQPFACYLLMWDTTNKKWDWIKNSFDKPSCIAKNRCSQGGSCYKWAKDEAPTTVTPRVVVSTPPTYACYILDWNSKERKWSWNKTTRSYTKESCEAKNRCSQGGMCYKWDVKG